MPVVEPIVRTLKPVPFNDPVQAEGNGAKGREAYIFEANWMIAWKKLFTRQPGSSLQMFP